MIRKLITRLLNWMFGPIPMEPEHDHSEEWLEAQKSMLAALTAEARQRQQRNHEWTRRHE